MIKRVFILSQQSMFSKGIETLLSHEAGIEIMSTNTDLITSLECIKKDHPDIVIVNCDDPENALSSVMLDIIRDRLGVCVIGLSLQDNQISIFRGENKQVRQVEDLLEILHE